MIKAVFFDIDNTLYNSSQFSRTAREAALRAIINSGVKIEFKEAMKLLKQIITEYGSNYPHHFNVFSKRVLGYEDPKLIALAVMSYQNVKYALFAPFPETVPVILKLKNAGYKLGIISNGSAVKQWDKLIRLKLQYFFDVVEVSEDPKIEKPNIQIFQEAMKKLNVKPKESIYIGDRLEVDILGANNAGMHSVWIGYPETKYSKQKPKSKEEKPEFKITTLDQIFDVIDKLSK